MDLMRFKLSFIKKKKKKWQIIKKRLYWNDELNYKKCSNFSTYY